MLIFPLFYVLKSKFPDSEYEYEISSVFLTDIFACLEIFLSGASAKFCKTMAVLAERENQARRFFAKTNFFESYQNVTLKPVFLFRDRTGGVHGLPCAARYPSLAHGKP